MITKEMTIAEAVKRDSSVLEILSDIGIDFCCGGHEKLEKALIEKNLDVESTIQLLNRKTDRKDVELENLLEMEDEKLIQYIIDTHHKDELALFEKIEPYLIKLNFVHYEHHHSDLEQIYKIFTQMKADMVSHFAKEEQQDFPKMRNREAMDFGELEREHEHVGSLLQALEEATDGYSAPKDGCETYRYTFKLMKNLQDDIHRHIFLENSVLFERLKGETK